jgi:hypothetical protein
MELATLFGAAQRFWQCAAPDRAGRRRVGRRQLRSLTATALGPVLQNGVNNRPLQGRGQPRSVIQSKHKHGLTPVAVVLYKPLSESLFAGITILRNTETYSKTSLWNVTNFLTNYIQYVTYFLTSFV